MSETPAGPSAPENLTGPGRRVLDLASEEARALKHNHVGTEHLLLGLIREADSAAAQALLDEGVTLDAARAVLVEELGQGKELWSQQLLTRRAKRVFDLAAGLADRGGPRLIGPEQILWGLVRDGEGYGALVLIRLGANTGDLHRQMAELSLPEPDEPDYWAEVASEGEWADLRRRLVDAGVPGGEWFGRSVTDPERHFDRPVDPDRDPRFDEKRAMPVLLEALPGLTDPTVVETVRVTSLAPGPSSEPSLPCIRRSCVGRRSIRPAASGIRPGGISPRPWRTQRPRPTATTCSP